VDDPARAPLEYSVVMILMLLLSPMSSMAHFGVLVVPGFTLAVRAFKSERRVSRYLLYVAIATAFLANKNLFGGTIYTMGLWCGSVMMTALLLLIACLNELLSTEFSRGRDIGHIEFEKMSANRRIDFNPAEVLAADLSKEAALASSPACTRASSASA
jgi:hypothetical protein